MLSRFTFDIDDGVPLKKKYEKATIAREVLRDEVDPATWERLMKRIKEAPVQEDAETVPELPAFV